MAICGEGAERVQRGFRGAGRRQGGGREVKRGCRKGAERVQSGCREGAERVLGCEGEGEFM
jgi:hypothetical protein